MIGAARRTATVLIKPTVDRGARDPVERQCPEIRQKLGFQSVVHAFPGRGFKMVVTRRLPFSLDEVTEFGHGHFHGFIRSLAGLVPELEFKAFEPRILHRFQADGAKTVAPGTASDAAVIHPCPIAGWLDPDTEAGCFRVPDRVLGLARSEPARIGVGQSNSSRRIFWHRSCLPGEDRSNCLDRRAHRSMVEMRVFQRRGRIVVAEEPGNRGNRRAIQEGHRGVAVPEVMQPDIAKSGLVSHLLPVISDHRRVKKTPPSPCRKYPRATPGKPIQYPAGRRRQPDRPRPGLGVAQIQVSLAVVGPFEGEDFVAAATGQEQQPDRCDLNWMIRFMPTQYGAEPLHLFRREKALASAPSVSPDADTGVGTLRAIAINLGLPEENAEHGRRPVGGEGRRMKRGEPLFHVPLGDSGDLHVPEPGQDLILEIITIDLSGADLPVPLAGLEQFLRDHSEPRLLVRGGNDLLAVVEGGEDRPCAAARFFEGHSGGIADDAPGTGPLMLALHKITFDAGTSYADAETLEFRVADIEGFLVGFESVDQTLGKSGIGHDFLPVFVAPREQKRAFLLPGNKITRENMLLIQCVSTAKCGAWCLNPKVSMNPNGRPCVRYRARLAVRRRLCVNGCDGQRLIREVVFVINVFSRHIVGWWVSRSLHTDLVLDALEQAFGRG